MGLFVCTYFPNVLAFLLTCVFCEYYWKTISAIFPKFITALSSYFFVLISSKLCLYREYHEPKLGVYIFIENLPESRDIIEIRGIDVTYVSSGEKSTVVEDTMSKFDPPKPMEIPPDTAFWQSTCGWPDHASIIFLILNVVKRKRNNFLKI